MKYAEFVIGGITNRNKIYNVKEFRLNGIRTDCFRSLFLYDERLKTFVEKTGTVSGYSGEHITESIPFDFDGDDLSAVKNEVVNFILHLYHTYELPFDFIRISFSGAKGFHLAIPFQIIFENPKPKDDFYKIVKGIAEDLSQGFKYVDFSIYEPKRIFRMLNTINSKTGLYKIPLSFEELDSLSIEHIKELAKKERNIESLPLSEMMIVPALKELYLKWENGNSFNKVESKKDELLDLIKNGSNEGSRHKALIRITSALQEKGLSFDFILEILNQWNAKNNPPLEYQRIEQESKRCFDDNRKKKEVKDVEIYDLKKAFNKYQDYVSKLDSVKVKTGFDVIDNKLRGIMPGETLCILGKTSVGKSAFLQNIGINFALQSGEPVLFFSMEMPVTSVFERTMQIETGYSGFEIENGLKNHSSDMQTKAKLLFNKLSNFYTITKSGLNLDSIKSLIQLAENNIYHKKTGLVLIDYLGLVKESGDLYEATSRVARGMKDLAKEMNVPVIYLSQVTKKYSEFDELELGAARDSGSVDEASDFVLALWKERDNSPEQKEIKLKLGILKNRKGGTGKTSIEMDKRSLKILENN